MKHGKVAVKPEKILRKMKEYSLEYRDVFLYVPPDLKKLTIIYKIRKYKIRSRI